MNETIRKFGPLAAVFAVLGYLSWEQLGGQDQPFDLGGSKTVRLERKLLEPDVPPPSSRNPLKPVMLDQADGVFDPATGKFINAPLASIEVAPKATPSEIAAGFHLQGTSYGNQQKSALINDRVCLIGQPVPSKSDHECTLEKVERDFVILALGDQTVRLGYDNVTIRDKETSGVGMPAVPKMIRQLNALFSSIGRSPTHETQN